MAVPVLDRLPRYQPVQFQQTGNGTLVMTVHPGYAGGLHAVDVALRTSDKHCNVPLDKTNASDFMWRLLHLTSYASNEHRVVFEEQGGVDISSTWYPCDVKLDAFSTDTHMVLSHFVQRVCLKTNQTLVSKTTVTLPNRKLRRLVQDTRHAMLDLGVR